MSLPLLGQRCDRGEEIIKTIRRYAVQKGSNLRDGIKRCTESASDESSSDELPELDSILVSRTKSSEEGTWKKKIEEFEKKKIVAFVASFLDHNGFSYRSAYNIVAGEKEDWLSLRRDESSAPWTTLRSWKRNVREKSTLRKIRRYAVRKGSNSRDGIKRCPESALDEFSSGELPELGYRFKINMFDCRGQYYDNDSNMSGQYDRLQDRIKAANEKVKYVP
ncbi:hypothetical protein OUZ56_017299 [Daphnia magna]|uniref:Uncharacterized protein n=1 Tax=Daphnia magna TaxID=35525 RepID=A0ABR0ASP9_9CRUS|nr:hypothetical protein OUZ56_017299 [Daphnia magna]